jgi:hypothetical protein
MRSFINWNLRQISFKRSTQKGWDEHGMEHEWRGGMRTRYWWDIQKEGDQDVGWWIILKWILWKSNGVLWLSGGVLWTRKWTDGFSTMLGCCGLVARLTTSEEGSSSLKCYCVAGQGLGPAWLRSFTWRREINLNGEIWNECGIGIWTREVEGGRQIDRTVTLMTTVCCQVFA